MSTAVESTRDFAEEYLFANTKLAIAVPSVIVPEGYNLIINPLYSQFITIFKSIKKLGVFVGPGR